jgi:osmoprotectant transport system substrate-binding protein
MRVEPPGCRFVARRLASCVRLRLILVSSLSALCVAACGSSSSLLSTTRSVASAGPATTSTTTTSTTSTTTTSTTSTTTSSTSSLPGTGKPAVVIGDKNYTEQFILGQLYYDALQAYGFNVTLNRNIGATSVTIQALATGRLAMYPEYLQTWNTQVAGSRRTYRTALAAYMAGQRYALGHGFELLNPTPFSDTWAIAVTVGYAAENHLNTIRDLHTLGQPLTLGGPPELQSGPEALLPSIEHAYGVVPNTYDPLAIGDQYPALDAGSVQAAFVNTTDGQLAFGDYQVLADPRRVFGWGQVVPVLSEEAANAEGPVFTEIINRVSALLTTPAMRQLNALVDVAGENPTVVAKQFLATHGVLPGTSL